MPPAVSGVRHFVLPDLGEGLTEADVVAWQVAVGDDVVLNQVLLAGGDREGRGRAAQSLRRHRRRTAGRRGETVPVGAPLVAIDTAEEVRRTEDTVPMLVGYGPSETPPSRRRRNGRGHPEHVPAARPARSARPLASPPVRFMARQSGVDLTDVTGHGPGGVITREDLAAHLAAGRRPPPARRGPPLRASRSTWRRPWRAAWPRRRRPASSSPSM